MALFGNSDYSYDLLKEGFLVYDEHDNGVYFNHAIDAKQAIETGRYFKQKSYEREQLNKKEK